MDNRLYFVLGDLLANILVGAVVGWLCAALVSTGWNMWLAMFICMALGMFIALLMWLPLGYFFGAMEVMVPAMLTGMISGMAVGMWGAMHALSAASAIQLGATCGLICIVFIWVFNNSIRGISEQ